MSKPRSKSTYGKEKESMHFYHPPSKIMLTNYMGKDRIFFIKKKWFLTKIKDNLLFRQIYKLKINIKYPHILKIGSTKNSLKTITQVAQFKVIIKHKMIKNKF